MGYFINGLEIAKETATPAKVSLVGNPNYIEFSSKATGANKPVEIQLEITGSGWVFIKNEVNGIKIYENRSKFTIIEQQTGAKHEFEGTSNTDEIKPGVFYMGPFSQYTGSSWNYERDKMAESLKNCLLENEFINRNFDVSIPYKNTGGTIGKGEIIYIKSKGYGLEYAFEIDLFKYGENQDGEDIRTRFFTIHGNPLDTASNDTIGEGYSNVEIQIELYKDTGIFLGEDDNPANNSMGSLAMTLTKAYSYSPIWFNLNILENNKIPADFLTAEDWVNTCTVNNFRFTARRVISGKNYYDKSLFYYSPVLYAITGSRRTLESNDLADYVFDTAERLKNTEEIEKVKPLSNQPPLFHIKGQTQYFNFILSDAEHSVNISKEYQLGIVFKIYSQSGRLIADEYDHFKARQNFNEVNTVRLNLDKAIEGYENAGKVEAYLAYRYADEVPVVVSKPLIFNILPECLHKVKDFAFLNSLGGWSSFNFPGTEQTEFKTEANTIFKTQTPHYSVSSEIESVYNKNVTEQFTEQTMPITLEACNWLKELSASKAVYELSTKRYVIVDEMNIKPNTKDALFRLDMKYHYSDSYN